MRHRRSDLDENLGVLNALAIFDLLAMRFTFLNSPRTLCRI